ncbi:hypothetical protein QZH41_011643 [Actinostola sp. cb2023]|nr:hypothetical protein QZH41_011643 [Actinostola sp. cb2023]
MGVSELETLRNLVDSSLKSPEYGVVNFHHLHRVLHGILSHLGLKYDGKDLASEVRTTTDNTKNDTGTIATESPESDERERPKEITDHAQAVEKRDDSEKDEQDFKSSISKGKTSEVNYGDQDVERLKSQQRHLENKISNLEDKLKLLDDFPSNKAIIQEARKSDVPADATKDSSTQLSGLWQFMKVHRRLQAAEDAIDRIMSILHEFLGSGEGKSVGAISNTVQDLSTELQQLKDQLKESSTKDIKNNDDSLMKKDTLDDKIIDSLATKDELKEYVKWPALEEALQIKKDKNKGNGINREVNIITFDGEKPHWTKENAGGRPRSSPAPPTQSPVSLPEVPKTAMITEATQVTSKDIVDDDKDLINDDKDSTHPSPELVECLRRISELNDEHNKMSEIVATKMDKVDLSIPVDLQDQLNELKKG